VEGERSSKYFCNLEKRHFTEKAIPKLILDNGIEITNQDDILTQQNIFYEALYTSKGTVVNDNHFIFPQYYLPVPTVIFARYFLNHFPFCPFLFS
jgi:hypothetical protein